MSEPSATVPKENRDPSDNAETAAPAPTFAAVALVDYDNVRPLNERTTKDAADNLLAIRQWINEALAQLPIRVNEVELRVYGGWTDEKGTVTRRANWLLASLSSARGLLNGVRYLPNLPTSIAAKALRLRGLYRLDRSIPEQKMVDTLMAVDAVHFSDGAPRVLIVVTDDDDLVPALLAASEKSYKACCLLRFRPKGAAINDQLLDVQRIHLMKIGP